MVKVVGIKFKNSGKLYYFAPKEGDVYERNMPVVVETARGLEYAWVAYPEKEVTDDDIVSPLKPVVRIATEKDTQIFEENQAKKPQAMQLCKEKIFRSSPPLMKMKKSNESKRPPRCGLFVVI